MSKEIILKPIGFIESPFKTREDLCIPPYDPKAPCHDPNVKGIVHIFEEFSDGLLGITPGSSAMLMFFFHRSKGYNLISKSPRFKEPTGVFSTRSPRRPNGIGISVVTFTAVEGCQLTFHGVDMLDGSPLLDIKPYTRNAK